MADKKQSKPLNLSYYLNHKAKREGHRLKHATKEECNAIIELFREDIKQQKFNLYFPDERALPRLKLILASATPNPDSIVTPEAILAKYFLRFNTKGAQKWEDWTAKNPNYRSFNATKANLDLNVTTISTLTPTISELHDTDGNSNNRLQIDDSQISIDLNQTQESVPKVNQTPLPTTTTTSNQIANNNKNIKTSEKSKTDSKPRNKSIKSEPKSSTKYPAPKRIKIKIGEVEIINDKQEMDQDDEECEDDDLVFHLAKRDEFRFLANKHISNFEQALLTVGDPNNISQTKLILVQELIKFLISNQLKPDAIALSLLRRVWPTMDDNEFDQMLSVLFKKARKWLIKKKFIQPNGKSITPFQMRFKSSFALALDPSLRSPPTKRQKLNPQSSSTNLPTTSHPPSIPDPSLSLSTSSTATIPSTPAGSKLSE